MCYLGNPTRYKNHGYKLKTGARLYIRPVAGEAAVAMEAAVTDAVERVGRVVARRVGVTVV